MSLPSSAIFSPTAARLAASAAKDWNTIDSWLHRHFHGRSVPKFERNADTLKALLALSTFNEAADEERDLVHAVEKEALSALQEYDEKTATASSAATTEHELVVPLSQQAVVSSILSSLELALPRDGKAALDALAQTAVALSPSPLEPSPETLASKFIFLQAEVHMLEQNLSRLAALISHLDTDAAQTEELLRDLQGPPSDGRHHDDEYEEGEGHENSSSNPYMPHPALAKSNLETQRMIKKLEKSLPSSYSTAALIEQNEDPNVKPSHHHTIPQVQELENSYKELLSKKRTLENEVGMFEGLPTDVHAAKQELDRRRKELAKMTVKRDVLFEGLVERESPIKKR